MTYFDDISLNYTSESYRGMDRCLALLEGVSMSTDPWPYSVDEDDFDENDNDAINSNLLVNRGCYLIKHVKAMNYQSEEEAYRDGWVDVSSDANEVAARYYPKEYVYFGTSSMRCFGIICKADQNCQFNVDLRFGGSYVGVITFKALTTWSLQIAQTPNILDDHLDTGLTYLEIYKEHDTKVYVSDVFFMPQPSMSGAEAHPYGVGFWSLPLIENIELENENIVVAEEINAQAEVISVASSDIPKIGISGRDPLNFKNWNFIKSAFSGKYEMLLWDENIFIPVIPIGGTYQLKQSAGGVRTTFNMDLGEIL